MRTLKKYLSVAIFALFAACSGDDSTSVDVIDISSDTNSLSSSSSNASSSSVLQSSSIKPVVYGELIDDRDGQVYKTVIIHGKEWLAENLNYAYLQPTADLDSSSWCYDDDPENCKKYGRLYLWSAAMDSVALFGEAGKGCGNRFLAEPCSSRTVVVPVRGVCPESWHLIMSDDINFLDSTWNARKEPSSEHKSKDGWIGDGNGTNSSGLNVLPSGAYSPSEKQYYDVGEKAHFWTSHWSRKYPYELLFQYDKEYYYQTDEMKNFDARSVRCVRDFYGAPVFSIDVPVSHGTMTDNRDGHVYKTVTVDNRTWMAENLNYAYLQPTASLDSSSWCYDNDPANCEKYGRLYLWSAAIDSAALFSNAGRGYDTLCVNLIDDYKGPCGPVGLIPGVCPAGWRLPSSEEWWKMINLGNSSNRPLKVKNEWKSKYTGTDEIGFSVLPAGYLDLHGPLVFSRKGWVTDFWTYENLGGPVSAEFSKEDGLEVETDLVAFSVRCIKDSLVENEDLQGVVIDKRDGQAYRTAVINGLLWMIENLNYAYLQPTSTLDSSSWCYKNDPDYCTWNGRLYLWSAAMDSAALFSDEGKGCGYFSTQEEHDCSAINGKNFRGICPEGWRLPSYSEELGQLTNGAYYLGGYAHDQIVMRQIGYYDVLSDRFVENAGIEDFWLSTEYNGEKAYHDNFDPWSLAYSEGTPLSAAIRAVDKRTAYPVRCVKSLSK